jgi:hypothetical protein
MPERKPQPPKRTRPGAIRVLVAANIAALGFLAVIELSAAARAQQRPRGTYTAASGRIEGTDEATQDMIAVQWDPRAKQIKGLGYRSTLADAAELMRPRSN